MEYDAAFGQCRGRITSLSAWPHAQSEPLVRGTVLPGVPPLTPMLLVMGAGGRCCSALLRLPASLGCLILFIFSFLSQGYSQGFVGTPLPKHERDWLAPPVEWRCQGGAGEQLRRYVGSRRRVVTPVQEMIQQPGK